MAFGVAGLPFRAVKPRTEGVTMVLDKGLSTTQAGNVAELGAPYVDVLKFGWGTALVSPNIQKKIEILRGAGIDCYFGGTLFEWFLVRNRLDDFLRFVDSHGVTRIEISNGTIWIEEHEKAELIQKLSKNYTVYSEVGSKDPSVILAPEVWIRMIQLELQAGAEKVICEGRESGNVGLFEQNGSAKHDMIDQITAVIDPDKLIFEAPNKDQQVLFIKKFGPNVNLGNINPWDIIPLETIRVGLRSDTLYHFLDPEYQKRYESVNTVE